MTICRSLNSNSEMGIAMHGLVNPYECERRDGVAPVS